MPDPDTSGTNLSASPQTPPDIAAAVERMADDILRAAGSALRHYGDYTRRRILAAALDGYEAAYRAGANRVLGESREAMMSDDPFADFSLKPEGCEMGYNCEPGFKDYPHHTWWIKGIGGGVHIWARKAPLEGWPTEWIGGVEVHHADCPDSSGWFDPDKPSQPDCWLLNGPCWHDGTSLYFSERIAPRMRHPDADNANDFGQLPHRFIGFELVEWFQDKIARSLPTGGDDGTV